MYNKKYYDKNKEKVIADQKEYYKKNKEKYIEYSINRKKKGREYINKIKMKSNGCVRCGYKEHPVAMDFDHIDPNTKSKNVAHLATYSFEQIDKEIAKCQILCANCHRIKTWKNRQQIGPIDTPRKIFLRFLQNYM